MKTIFRITGTIIVVFNLFVMVGCSEADDPRVTKVMEQLVEERHSANVVMDGLYDLYEIHGAPCKIPSVINFERGFYGDEEYKRQVETMKSVGHC